MKSINFNFGEFKLVRESDRKFWLDLLFVRKNVFLIEVLKLSYSKTHGDLERNYHVFTDDELALIHSFENEESLTLAR